MPTTAFGEGVIQQLVEREGGHSVVLNRDRLSLVTCILRQRFMMDSTTSYIGVVDCCCISSALLKTGTIVNQTQLCQGAS